VTRLLIAGCGDLGIRLGRLWIAGGGCVVALRRRVEHLQADFVPLAHDLAQPLPPNALRGDWDAVAYLASADARQPEAYQRAYVDGLRHILAALPAPPPRLIFASSTAVYAEDAGAWVDEESPTAPTAFNGEILRAAERLLCGMPATVLRFSGLYGPGRQRLWQRALSTEPGSARWSNRIHVDDAAAAACHVLKMARPPACLCVSDDQPASEATVLAYLRQLQGANAGPMKLPVEAAVSGRRVSNQRLRASGFQLRYPSYVEGYAALAATAALL